MPTVPKKLPMMGCENSCLTTSGYLTSLRR
jgi:hypothetical protein